MGIRALRSPSAAGGMPRLERHRRSRMLAHQRQPLGIL